MVDFKAWSCQSEVRLGEDEVPDDPRVLECVLGIRPSPIFRLCKSQNVLLHFPRYIFSGNQQKANMKLVRIFLGNTAVLCAKVDGVSPIDLCTPVLPEETV